MTVAIVKAEGASGVGHALELLGGIGRFVAAGEKVVVKPNICAAKDSASGTVTDPEITAEVCRLAALAGGEVTVAESPIYPFKSSRVFPRAGYGDFEARYGFPLVDIDTDDCVEIKVPGGVAVQREVVAKRVLEADRVINVPVLKTHLQTTVTCALKNLKGVVPAREKHIIHVAGLDDGIVDINTVVRTDLVVVDAIDCMEGTGGPANGRPLHLGLIIAGDNPVEVDSVCLRIMGVDPRRVDHVRRAAERGLGRLDGFEVRGEEVETVRVDFTVPATPHLNRFLISGFFLKVWTALANVASRFLGRSVVTVGIISGEVKVLAERCDACAVCVKACPVKAISMRDKLPRVDREKCILCFCCAEACPQGALEKG
ncbi:MAG: DUF362 domain-containing protein [Actinobacteria bacterium]|nr:DUF362 domain-containing protein [Actinomycetota bacterium]